MFGNRVKSSLGWAQLEGVDESVGVGEAGTNSVEFVDQIFDADDSLGSQRFFDEGVVENGGSSTFSLGKSSLVDQFSDGLEVRISPGNVRFNNLQHVKGSLIDSQEDSIVDLSKSHQLKNFSRFGVDLVNTSNSNNKSNFGFWCNIIISSLSGSSFVS